MLICGMCRSNDVQLLAWVNANNKEFVEWLDDEHLGWCESCGAQVNVKYLPDSLWEKKQKEKEKSDRESDNPEGSDS